MRASHPTPSFTPLFLPIVAFGEGRCRLGLLIIVDISRRLVDLLAGLITCRNTRLLAFMVDCIDDFLSTMYKCAVRLTT